MPDAGHVAMLVFAAALATVSLMLLAWAYARAEASYLSSSEYTSFAWAALFGFVVFGERLTLATLCGAALIVGACAFASRLPPTVLASPEASP